MSDQDAGVTPTVIVGDGGTISMVVRLLDGEVVEMVEVDGVFTTLPRKPGLSSSHIDAVECVTLAKGSAMGCSDALAPGVAADDGGGDEGGEDE